jgi:hypothetical protein
VIGSATVGGSVLASIKQARAFVRKLGLPSLAEWFAYFESGKRPTILSFFPHTLPLLTEGCASRRTVLQVGKNHPRADDQFLKRSDHPAGSFGQPTFSAASAPAYRATP